MTPMHAYLSALITTNGSGLLRSDTTVMVKAHTWSFGSGWKGDRRIQLLCWNGDSPRWDSSSLGIVKSRLRDLATERADMVPLEVYRLFGVLAAYICAAHGESYPTWIGDMYIHPVKKVRGDSWRSRFLITEAPGLDCGHWEGELSPVRGE